VTKVGFVDHVGRGAEFIGDFGQRQLTDTKSTQLIDVRGQRPYWPIYSRRGGVLQRRQDLVEGHNCCPTTVFITLLARSEDGLLSIVMTLNAGVDVATANTARRLMFPTTSTGATTRRTIESSKAMSADEDAMTANTRTRRRFLP
jgi:hypothetical protein